MKTHTLATLGAALLLCSILVGMQPDKTVPKKAVVENSNAIWFNTIEIADGITVEFEYGPQLQVIVEGDQQIISQFALVLDHQVLKAIGNKTYPKNSIRIKVITPVLVNLARLEMQTAALKNTGTQLVPLRTMDAQGNLYKGMASGV